MGSILIVDDMKAVRMLIISMLEGSGCLCNDVASGSEALDLLSKQPIDLVIIDWMMEGLSGYETIEKMRQMPLTSQPKVVFLTGKKSKKDIHSYFS